MNEWMNEWATGFVVVLTEQISNNKDKLRRTEELTITGERRAKYFIDSYRFNTSCVKCCSIVFGVTLKFLVIKISSLSPAMNKLRRLLYQL